MITREALTFWQACDMRAARSQAIQEVDMAIEAGDVRQFSDWPRLIKHPEDCGIVEDEGAELEGDLEPGEAAFDEEDRRALEDAEELAEWASEASGSASVAALGPLQVLPEDDPASVDEATVAAKRLQQLRQLRDLAVSARVPAAAYSVARELDQLQRGLAVGGRGEKRRINNVLRRELDRQFDDERNRVQAAQQAALELRRASAQEKAEKAREKNNNNKKQETQQQQQQQKARAKAAALAAAAEKAALQTRFDAWPKVVSAAEAAQPVASVAKFRAQIWERIKLRSPPLSFAEEARWPQVRDDWAKMQPKIHTIAGVACHAFIELVNKVLERLGSYYTGVSNGNKGDATGGDP